MNPEKLVASLLAKAKTAEIISRELERPPPPPPPPPPRNVPSFITVEHENTITAKARAEFIDTLLSNISHPSLDPSKDGLQRENCRVDQRRSSTPAFSKQKKDARTVYTSKSPQLSTPSCTPAQRNKISSGDNRPTVDVKQASPVSVIRRVESLLSLEEMTELRSQLLATSSPSAFSK